MTCVVGLIADGEVWLGCDTAAVDGNSSLQHVRGKLFRLQTSTKDPFLIGYTTSFRMGQILQYGLTPPTRALRDDPEAYMATAFVDAVRAALRTGGWAKKENEREEGGTFLVGYAGRLFSVWDSFQVIEPISGYEAIGSGRYEALGALFATEGQPPEARARKALEAAEYFNGTVRAPFVIERLGR